MYFLWQLQVISCDVIGMEHALPGLGHGQSLTLLLYPHPSSMGLGLGVLPRRRIRGGTWILSGEL